MRGRDWFVVGVRLIAVWVLYTAVSYIATFAAFRFSDRSSPVTGMEMSGYLIHAAVLGLMGLFLLLGAQQIAQISYGVDEISEGQHPTKDEPSDKTKV